MSDDQISFGQFRLDLKGQGLLRDGRPVPLGSRALDILGVLASARGDVVTKDQLMERVWPGRVVEENNIQVHISALRKALDDGNTNQSHVVTVPGRGYRLIGVQAPASASKTNSENLKKSDDPGGPSIAVLPFQNLGGDPEQEYFADGMVEDIINALSRFKSLFVIERNSSFTYKDKDIDIKQVGRELGVRYLLKGSVRKAGSRVRIAGQLIDATTGAHLWADRIDGTLEDIFDLQDTVAINVVGAIAPRLIAADIERAKRKSPDSWDSYDFYLRGIAFFEQRTPQTTDRALELFRKSIDLDPEFGLAHIMAAASFFTRARHGGRPLTDEEDSETLRLTNRALDLAGDDAFVLRWASLIIARNNEIERGSYLSDRALAINPNLSTCWNSRGWISLQLGDAERALEAFDRATRLNPADDWTVLISTQGKGCSLMALDRRGEALEVAKRLVNWHPNDLFGLFLHCGVDSDPTGVAYAADQIRALYPHLRSSDLKKMLLLPLQNPTHRAIVGEAIARIGLLE
jgi:TolB-like protein